MTLFIRDPQGDQIAEIEINDPDMIISDVKKQIKCIPIYKYLLTFQGGILTDESATLADSGICPESTIQLFYRPVELYIQNDTQVYCMDFRIFDFKNDIIHDFSLYSNTIEYFKDKLIHKGRSICHKTYWESLCF